MSEMIITKLDGTIVDLGALDYFAGTSGEDKLKGSGADDLFVGSAGDDKISGSGGFNVVRYDSSIFDAMLDVSSGKVYLTTEDGSDKLLQISVIDFADYAVYLDGRNNNPFTRGEVAATDEDTVLSLTTLLDNDMDFDGDTLSISHLDLSLSAGSAVLNTDGSVDYDPAGAFDWLAVGETVDDSFVYHVGDGHGETTATGVTVTVTGVNDAVVVDVDASVKAGGVTELVDGTEGVGTAVLSATGQINFSDVDISDTHTATIVSATGEYRGTLTLTAPTTTSATTSGLVGWEFTVSDGDLNDMFEGEEIVQTYDVEISDGNGSTVVETISITLTGANEAPVAASDVIYINSDMFYGYDLTWNTAGLFSDANGDTLSYTADGLPAGFTIDSETGLISGALDAAAPHGNTVVTVTASDPYGASATFERTFIIKDPAPIANDDAFMLGEDGTVSGNVSQNDGKVKNWLGQEVYDYQYDATTGVVDAGPTLGNVTINDDGTFTYTLAEDGVHGTDQFAYTVTGPLGNTSTGVVTIEIPRPESDEFDEVAGDGDLGSIKPSNVVANYNAEGDYTGLQTLQFTIPISDVAAFATGDLSDLMDLGLTGVGVEGGGILFVNNQPSNSVSNGSSVNATIVGENIVLTMAADLLDADNKLPQITLYYAYDNLDEVQGSVDLTPSDSIIIGDYNEAPEVSGAVTLTPEVNIIGQLAPDIWVGGPPVEVLDTDGGDGANGEIYAISNIPPFAFTQYFDGQTQTFNGTLAEFFPIDTTPEFHVYNGQHGTNQGTVIMDIGAPATSSIIIAGISPDGGDGGDGGEATDGVDGYILNVNSTVPFSLSFDGKDGANGGNGAPGSDVYYNVIGSNEDDVIQGSDGGNGGNTGIDGPDGQAGADAEGGIFGLSYAEGGAGGTGGMGNSGGFAEYTIDGLAGDDVIVGGDGGDGGDVLSGTQRLEDPSAGGAYYTIAGGAGNDRIVGGDGGDAGSVALYADGTAGSSYYTIWGGDGNDEIKLGASGTSTAYADAQYAAYGGAGNDTLIADNPDIGSTNHALYIMEGGSGDDTMQISSEYMAPVYTHWDYGDNIFLNGGEGFDTLILTSSSTVNLTSAYLGDNFTGFEHFVIEEANVEMTFNAFIDNSRDPGTTDTDIFIQLGESNTLEVRESHWLSTGNTIEMNGIEYSEFHYFFDNSVSIYVNEVDQMIFG
ncbi:hypothetical protein GCM10017044_16520 [Kordiimonas sediminis]|uniref:Cadherin-like domain-containing protein n=1 Tax=Kordiimonas sediminis TaxID=1735581 RepID=A0A919ATS7_9PROT|nr:Ig-like domain-containing protein [Kordiimonas sediminis]GHF22838.1 hypothetical protein GCM10017044_16520 [Kordiimonas sediminis]